MRARVAAERAELGAKGQLLRRSTELLHALSDESVVDLVTARSQGASSRCRYGVNDFKENLLALYTKAGLKGQPVTFLLTDNQIVNEKFLVFMNDLLSTGLVSDLCSPEDVEAFSGSVRNEVKAAGIIETPENLWDFFIEKIRKCDLVF